jgi:hypothetical protein
MTLYVAHRGGGEIGGHCIRGQLGGRLVNERQPHRWARKGYALAVLVLPLLACAAASAATSAGELADATPLGTMQPVNVVILADESGSMQQYPNEVSGERQAAAQIVQEEWSPQSQIAIYGFGGAPEKRGAQPQSAIDQYCGPTELTGNAARTRLTQCAAEITPRTAAQGYNTDFAAALIQAKTVLGAPQAVNRLPLVFILTDGQLDVGQNSPYSGWPSSRAAGNAAAQKLITDPSAGILHDLRNIGTEIWPVGFGQADTSELDLFARGGAQNDCPAGSGATPKAAIVPPSATGSAETEDIQSKLIGAFAEARCAALGQSIWAQLPVGGSVHKTATISQLATLGALVVDKGDPRVEVTYTDPKGNKVSDNTPNGQSAGSIDGASYALTGGSQSPLETLRLDNPLPGPWQVTFTDPPGVPAQTVGLSVVWQGEVQLEFVNQQVGDPGHPYQIAVQPAVRSAPVPPSALAGFTAGFNVSWPGGQVARAQARLDASGDFSAAVTVPQGLNGTAVVTVTAAAPGVQGQARTAFKVSPGGGLTVSLNIPRGTTVAPGRTVTANATIDTNGLPATSIVFSLGGLSDGVDATIASPARAVPVGSGRQSFPLTIRFGPQTRLGPALGTIRWAPAGQVTPTPSDWLAVDSLDVNIEYPPLPVWEQWWFWLVILAAAAAGGAVLYKQWQDRRVLGVYDRLQTLTTQESRYGPLGGTGPRPSSDRYREPGGSPAANSQASPASEPRRRLPWRRR